MPLTVNISIRQKQTQTSLPSTYPPSKKHSPTHRTRLCPTPQPSPQTPLPKKMSTPHLHNHLPTPNCKLLLANTTLPLPHPHQQPQRHNLQSLQKPLRHPHPPTIKSPIPIPIPTQTIKNPSCGPIIVLPLLLQPVDTVTEYVDTLPYLPELGRDSHL